MPERPPLFHIPSSVYAPPDEQFTAKGFDKKPRKLKKRKKATK